MGFHRIDTSDVGPRPKHLRPRAVIVAAAGALRHTIDEDERLRRDREDERVAKRDEGRRILEHRGEVLRADEVIADASDLDVSDAVEERQQERHADECSHVEDRRQEHRRPEPALLPHAGSLAAVAGYPHLTVPMGFVRGLPVGLSLVGPAWSEAKLLQIGHAFEKAVQARQPPQYLPSLETSPDVTAAFAPSR